MEEDIKILEKYTEKDIPCDSCRYCTERPKVSKAVRNLIAKYKELEVINKMQEYRISVIDERELIPKSLVKEKIEELDDKDLEIYETDSEDVIISKYEDRAVLDFCNSLLED